MKFVITEDERKRIKSLYEQKIQDLVVPLTQLNYSKIDSGLKKDIENSLLSNYEIQTKLVQNEFNKNESVVDFLNSKGVVPYIFKKHVDGTGEKFGLMGLYLNLFGKDVKVKLNLNNTSDQLLNSLPWTFLSVNIPI